MILDAEINILFAKAGYKSTSFTLAEARERKIYCIEVMKTSTIGFRLRLRVPVGCL
jgi:hypothetical protein